MHHPILNTLKDLLDYYADEGSFWWKKTLSNNIVAGKKAGGFYYEAGRVTIGYQRNKLDAAEIAVFLHTGRVYESGKIGFKDGNPQNLKFNNLVEPSADF